ncbi:MAG: zinc-ribbon and FHA domain-containing protein [Actinomycetota bacterium]|nr:zinc-ribbon and FHA domain-containing protein [Actinomycetota bacterium]
MFCTQCGQQNPDDSRFCARCGTALSRPGGGAGTPGDSTSTIALSALESVLDGETGASGSDALEAPHESTAETVPPGSALLVVKRGPNAGSRFLLDSVSTTAGRHPESDIFLDDVTVSRRHAEFVREGTGFTVRDVGSLNGTYLNRERIEAAPLAGGDEVQIGKYRLVFLTGPRPGEGS